MLGKVARGRGNHPPRESWSVSRRVVRMSVELILISAMYIGVMAGVFTKGVKGAVRVHRDARAGH